MQLKIIGSDCSNGMKIMKNLKKVEKDLNIKLDIEQIPISSKEKYNIKIIPTIIINDKKISEGFVPSERELTKILKEETI